MTRNISGTIITDMTYELPLKEFIRLYHLTQSEAAQYLGISQGRISQILSENRDVRVVFNPDGTLSSYERKQVGKPNQAVPA